jgi:serine/threonine-protein kinase RsbW
MSPVPDPVAWSWPAEVSSVTTARHAVVDWLRQQGTPDPPLSDVALVVSEAVTNAVRHAYVGRPPGEITIQVALHDDELMVVIEDQGNGLRPRPDSPGLGYGLALIVAVAKRLEASSGEREGTRLVAWFSRDPADATLV